jgi:hypothetical protein
MLQWGISFWNKRRGVRIFSIDREGKGPVAQANEEKSSEGRKRAG